MAGDFPFPGKMVSPLKCNEKPWDLWVSELGHRSPRPDDDGAFTAPAAVDKAPGARRKQRRYRRAGVSRLRPDSMALHGLFPQLDALDAAVCHMCGSVVKCSAALRHLRERHDGAEPLLPPPPPTVKLKAAPRSRHKREPPPPPPPPAEPPPEPAPAPPPPPARVVLPPPDLAFVEEAAAALGEVQVSLESGELPVVSIQDTEELHLGETLTDDIFAIMNSEGIQSAEDITNIADWKNIIQDIGNMQDINFPPAVDAVQPQDLYPAVEASLAGYAISDADLPALHFAPAPSASPLLPSVIDNSLLNVQALKPAPATPSTKGSSRKSSKTKFNLREYDPNKHCGVVTAENPKPCTRSLTCKAHALSLRRTVEGRVKPFDTLLAEHRASRDAQQAPAPAPPPPPPPPPVAPAERAPSPEPARSPAPPDAPAPADVCWYAAVPRPLALCTFNAAHAGGAVTLGKKFATVRSNIKSSLSRSSKAAGAAGYYDRGLAMAKTLHANSASKTNKPEVRKLIVTCSAGDKRVAHALGDLFDVRHVNGHVERKARLKGKRGDLPFALDPLLADEKC